jgi:DNA invertase Pin-like site-specific DNA recombinase
MTKAVAYMRTSSATNVGADKDSEKRQRAAIEAYAVAAGYEIAEADWFYDAAVSGADAIEARPGFSSLLDRIESNGVKIVVVEDASRFARQLIVQEAGIIALIERGVRVLTSSGDDLTETSDPFKVAMRQIAGVFAQLEKARLVAKLKAARDRKKAETGKCSGRKSLAELRPDTVRLARSMRGQSLRKISAALAAEGHFTPTGRPYAPAAVKSMLREVTAPAS